MINNKVRITVLAAAIMLCGCSAAYAAKTIDTVQYDGNDRVTVRIQSDEARAAQTVSVRITDENGLANVFEQGVTDNNGLFEFSYVNKAGTGVYTIYAYINGELITGEYPKMNSGNYDEFVRTINEQHKSPRPDGTPIKAVFDRYAKFVDLDISALDYLDDPDAVYQFIADDISYRGSINSFDDVRKAYYAAVVLESFKENRESIFTIVQTDPYKEVIAEFAPVLEKAAAVVKPAVKMSVLTSLENDYISSRSLAETVELLVLQKTISNATHWNDVKTILEIYASDLGIKTDGVSSDVYKSMAGKNYTSYSAVVQAFEQLVSSSRNSNQSGGSAGGGGGGGGGGGSSKTVLPPSIMQDQPSNTPQPQPAVDVHSGQLPFMDMDDAQWAIKAVLYVFERGIVSGVSDTQFEPNRFITRAEAVKLLMAMNGIEPENVAMPFADVNENDWYYPYIATAYKKGIVSGRSDDFFDAQSMVTRQEMAVMTYRTIMLKHTLPDTLSEVIFADRSEIDDWALEAVTYLYSKDIMIGRSGSRFDPKDNITRAESATVIYNVLTTAL